MRAFAIFFLSLSPRARLVFVALVLVLIYVPLADGEERFTARSWRRLSLPLLTLS